MSTSRPIPKILHQTWKDSRLPAEWQPLRESWLRHHPDWEHRLWSDLDNRELIRTRYPFFLPTYDAYREPIRRVDAARYFLLHCHGGVYVDLDFEALKPVDPLLEGRTLVLGREPPEHVASPLPRERGMSEVICNAFMASRPEHPFWEHLFDRLAESRHEADTLDATGPFLLTRAVAGWTGEDLHIAPFEQLYPIGREASWSGAAASPELRRELEKRSYAIHYWTGSWWR